MKSFLLTAIALALFTLGFTATDASAGPRGGTPGGGGRSGPGGAGGAHAGPSGARTGGAGQFNSGAQRSGGGFNGGSVNPSNFNGGNLHPQAGAQNFNGRNATSVPGRSLNTNELNQFIGGDRTLSNRETNVNQRNIDQNNVNQFNVTNNQRTVQAQQVNVNMQPHLNGVFTPTWYGNNRNAWQNQYPHADAYAAAAWATTASWVGIGAQPVYYGYGEPADVNQTNNYYTSDNSATPQPTASTNLANAADNVKTNDADWLSLGVFGLVPGEHQNATGAVQLSVSKEGVINGTYVDLLSQAGTPVSGSVDKKSQLAAWKIGDNDKVIFETALSTLTSNNGALTVQYAGKPSQQWQLVRSQQ